MRILHTNMLRGWGGQSNRILTESLGARGAGCEVAFAIPDGSELMRRAREAGMEAFPGYRFKPPRKFWKFLPDLRRFLGDVRRWKPDIIHLHGSQDTWLAVSARRFLGDACPPMIRTKHNIFPWRQHASNRWLYRQVDAYISISSFIDRQVVEYPGLAEKPRALIKSVPDLGRFPGRVESMVRAELDLPEGTFLWGSTGRLRPEKAFDVLLPAFAQHHRECPGTCLIIAGDGSERHTLIAQARGLGLDERTVQFLGFRKDVPEILSALDGYVLSSRSEGLGTSILEALAVGLPVVATNVGGIPDSVEHERTGLLAETENPASIAAAMKRIVDDSPLRALLSENARAAIHEEFTVEKLTRDTVAFYQHVAATVPVAGRRA